MGGSTRIRVRTYGALAAAWALAFAAAQPHAATPASTAPAAEALASKTLALDGTREIETSLAYGKTQPLQLTVPANQSVLVRAESTRIDLTFDVQDGEQRYTSNSPANMAGIEYLAFDAGAQARVIELTLRPASGEGGSGDARVHLLSADDPHAPSAREWAVMSRAPREPGAEHAGKQAATLERLLAQCTDHAEIRCQADANLALGEVYETLARHDEERAAYAAALAHYQTLGSTFGEIFARYGASKRRYYEGDMAGAEAIYQQCRDLAHAAGLQFREAEFENYVAVMRHYSGDLDAALTHYLRARDVFGDLLVSSAAQVRNNIGGVYELRGDVANAVAAYEEAIAFSTAADLVLDRARAMSNLGAIQADMGRIQLAIPLLSQSLDTFAAMDSWSDETRVLAVLAYQYESLGRLTTAESLLDRGLALCAERNSPRCLAHLNSGLGRVARARGDMAAAEAAFRVSLEQAELLKMPHLIFIFARDLADLLVDTGKPADALALLDDTDTRWIVSAPSQTASPMLTLTRGRAYAALGRSDDASRTLMQLLDAPHVGVLRYRAQLELAQIDAQLGRWPAVEARVTQEIDRIAQIRQEFLDPLTRAQFLATRQEIFTLLMRAQLQRHAAGDASALQAAFETDERSRSRALLDALATTDAIAPASEGRRAARDTLRVKSLALQRLGARATPQDAAGLEALRSEVELARVKLETIEATDAGVQRTIAFGKPRGLKDTQAMLEPRQALLMFRLRDEHAWVWVVTHTGLRLVELPAAAAITARITRFAQTVRDGGRDSAEDGRWLHDTLVGAAGIDPAITQLTIVPDGPLHVLPFSALTMPDGRYLIEAVDVAQLPSASVGLALDRPERSLAEATGKDIVVFADPVFGQDDPRLGTPPDNASNTGNTRASAPLAGDTSLVSFQHAGIIALQGDSGTDLQRSGEDLATLARLPGTAREAQAIVDVFGAQRVDVYSGFDATVERVREAAVRDARILHFATHGLVDANAPELTGLALSRWNADGTPVSGDSLLSLAHIGELRFNADLVVLSACDSAIGERVEGEGLMGLARAFLASGAGSVVATLWPVSDRDAAKLESTFAQGLRAGATPVAALAAAKREAIRDPARRKPRSWAAFIYYGAP